MVSTCDHNHSHYITSPKMRMPLRTKMKEKIFCLIGRSLHILNIYLPCHDYRKSEKDWFRSRGLEKPSAFSLWTMAMRITLRTLNITFPSFLPITRWLEIQGKKCNFKTLEHIGLENVRRNIRTIH